MAEIKPKIVDGIKFWDVDPKNKKAFNEIFQEQITKIRDKELEAKRKVQGPNATLSKKEISALRNHRDLGIWLIDGEPASVTNLNDFFREGSKTNTLSLNVPKRKNKYFTRDYLNSKEHRETVLKPWFDRLDAEGWPKGRSKKGFINYLNRAYDQTAEYNKILEKRLGFNFNAGHFWGAIGPEGDRTMIGPYGPNSEGKFTFRNVTSQPTVPKMEQLLNPKWNVITPNIPGFYDKRGLQVAGADELLEAGAGGQGFQGSMVDYLLEGTEDLDKMDAWEKAYIAFGDPNKGGGATVEVRKAQMLDPFEKEKVLKTISEYTETAEDLSGPVRTIKPGSPENWDISSKGNYFAFSDAGAGVGAIPMDGGLLSQSWRAALTNADDTVTNLTKNLFQAEKIFTLQGGYNQLGKTMSRDFAFGTPFMYAFDKDFREDLHSGDYASASERAVKDYVAGEVVGRTAQFGWGLLPEAVRNVVTTGASVTVGAVKKASPYALTMSLGGSSYRPKPRWEETGFPSEEVYNTAIEELTAEKNTMHASYHTTSYDRYLKRKEKMNEENEI